jgi:hypothetical protein
LDILRRIVCGVHDAPVSPFNDGSRPLILKRPRDHDVRGSSPRLWLKLRRDTSRAVRSAEALA